MSQPDLLFVYVEPLCGKGSPSPFAMLGVRSFAGRVALIVRIDGLFANIYVCQRFVDRVNIGTRV